MANSLADSRCYVHVGDGVQYMKENKNCFDVIITDAPDPIGKFMNAMNCLKRYHLV
jgi:spermidine synthase